MATHKGQGSTQNGRDSRPKYLGVKVGDGEIVRIGNVLVRQRGTKFHPGYNVAKGGDDTLYALANGKVKFERRKGKVFVSVYPIEEFNIYYGGKYDNDKSTR
jgi:large subunit ribosomal protein L27